MDLVLTGLISIMTSLAITSTVVQNANIKQPRPRRTRTRLTQNPYKLPAPGKKLELYARTTEVMDALVDDKREASRERDAAIDSRNAALSASKAAREERDEAIAECERLEEKLDVARDIIRAYTHPKMQINLEKRQPRKKIAITI